MIASDNSELSQSVEEAHENVAARRLSPQHASARSRTTSQATGARNQHRPLLFNPTRAPSNELETTFVGRHSILQELIETLLADASGNHQRHWLLVGPRGSGKSHLSELLVRRMTSEHGWLTARLPEEHYQVGSVCDFLEQIIVHCEGRRLFTARDAGRERSLIEHIQEITRRSSVPILAVVENLNMLFEQLASRSEQERLRAILSGEIRVVVVATATSYVDATIHQKASFYDFFETIELTDLSRDDVADLIKARARWDGATDLIHRFDEVRPRLDAIYHLSGGNPRLVLALYAVLREGVTNELHAQVMHLLDEVTPYFQSRLRDISPQAVRVLLCIALAEGPIQPTEIGQRVHLPTNQVTAQLSRLIDERMVVVGPKPTGRSRLYEVKDRIFRLWLQMREDPSTGERLRFIIEFFQRWYAGQNEELLRDAQDIADAFWNDLGTNNRHGCKERIRTLDYLASAVPEYANRVTHYALAAHVDTTSSAELSRDTERVERLLENAEGTEREKLALLACELRKAQGDHEAALEHVESVTHAGTRDVFVVSTYLAGLIFVGNFAKAYEVARQFEPNFVDAFKLREVKAVAAAHLGKVEEAIDAALALIGETDCDGCRYRLVDRVGRTLARAGYTSPVRELFLKSILLREPGRKVSSDALNALIEVASGDTKRKSILGAVQCWTDLANAPAWFLQAGICCFSHSQKELEEAVSFLEAMARHHEGEVPSAAMDHLVEVCAWLLSEAESRRRGLLARTLQILERADVELAFAKAAPGVARKRPKLRPHLIALYSYLREENLIRRDVQPYAEALAIVREPNPAAAMARLHPEVREAVEVLLPEQSSSVSPHR